MAAKKKKVFNWSLVWSALLGLLVGLGIGYALWVYTVPEAKAISFKVTICHEPGRNQQTLRVDASALRGHIGHGDYLGPCRPLPTPTPIPTRPPTPTPTPQPTTRMCHWNGQAFEAIAVTASERTRHFNAHKLDKDWLTGMDADCEYPPTPTPTPVPTNLPEEEHHASPPGAPPGRCHASTHPVITQAVATRNGTSANIAYVPTAGEDGLVNVVYSENPFEIVFNLGDHGLRDWLLNNGNVQLNDLVEGQSYYYRIANGCSWWSGIFFIQ